MIIKLHYDPDGTGTQWLAEELEVEPAGEGRFRLLEAPVFAEGTLNPRDVVAVEARPDGGWGLREVVERSGYRTHSWTLSAELIASPAFVGFCQEVQEAGGSCEQLFGGLVRVVIPPGSGYDAPAAVRALHAPPARPSYRRAPPRRPWWRLWGR